MLTLLAAVPASAAQDVMGMSDLMELNCNGVFQLAQHMYCEYLAHVAPAAVMLKMFSQTFVVHQRQFVNGSVIDMVQQLEDFRPLAAAKTRLSETFAMRRLVVHCAAGAVSGPECAGYAIR